MVSVVEEEKIYAEIQEVLMDGPDTGEPPPASQDPMAAGQISNGEEEIPFVEEQIVYAEEEEVLTDGPDSGKAIPTYQELMAAGQISDGEAAEQLNTIDISEVTPLSDNPQDRNVTTTPSEEHKDKDKWMSLPTDIPISCPAGLEYLYYIDCLHIYKDMGIWEAIYGIRTKGSYKIKNKDKEQVFYAKDDSNWFLRYCCDPSNPFGIKIMDRSSKEVIRLERPIGCTYCCSPCCLQKLLVYSPPGHLAGTVEQEVETFKFRIKDNAGATVLKIKGPDTSCWTSSCTANLRILNLEGQLVGKIWKHWYDDEDPFSERNHCGVSFLPTMNVRLKAILLGASFLMDSLYYGD